MPQLHHGFVYISLHNNYYDGQLYNLKQEFCTYTDSTDKTINTITFLKSQTTLKKGKVQINFGVGE